MRIGFLGIQCDNPNLGVSALAYAGLNLVHGLAGEDDEFVLFSENSADGVDRMRAELGLGDRIVDWLPFRHRSPRRMLRTFRAMRDCGVVIDFTGGDSFSDIYGWRRLAKVLLHKEMVLLGRTGLVLAPQTYGPFAGRLFLPWVRHVLRRAALVFTRDAASADYLARLTDREVVLTTDVAVTLPFDHDDGPSGGGGALVGFNVSGLLWRGGYTGDNQFSLRVDYREFCRGVIAGLQATGYRVSLVPHVLPDGRRDGEGELAACRELAAEFPAATLAPGFASPVAAKSWIAGTDAFIGSRMHATIGAFTAGIPTVPVAYSRKFAGMFGSLGYDALVDLTRLSTPDAVAETLRLVNGRDRLVPEVDAANQLARRRIEAFSERLGGFLADSR